MPIYSHKNWSKKYWLVDKRSHSFGMKRGKKIKCLTNGIIYDSVTSAAKELNVSITEISKVARGNKEQTKGFKFKYL